MGRPPFPRIVALLGARVYFGQERANLDALVALKSEGCDVVCVARPEPWTAQFAERAEERGLTVIKLPYVDFPTRRYLLGPLLSFLPRMAAGNALLLRFLRSYGATHIHVCNQQHAVSFYPTLALSRLPVIYRSGDQPILHRALYRWIWRFLTHRVACFVADTKFIRASLVASGVPKERVTVLYAPPPVRLSRSDEALPAAPPAPGEFRFAYVGQVTQAKGVGHLVDAFRSVARVVDEARLVIVGSVDNSDPWQAELLSQVSGDPVLRRTVTFTGFTENVPAVLAHAHVHVAPSLGDEPYGLVVVEAKAAGLPSVIYPSGGMQELVRDGFNGRVCARKDSADLAEALLDYCRNPVLASSHGAAARSSLDALALDRFGSRWLAIYEKAATPSPVEHP
jgi:glycosyltransferase involved in cell wall biosynthesis